VLPAQKSPISPSSRGNFRIYAKNYKTKVPPIRAPAMTMTAERSGSCSMAVAPLLDVVLLEEVLEALTELVPEAEGVDAADATVEEVDAGSCALVKQFKKGNAERR
jgi:hypothetical protein